MNRRNVGLGLLLLATQACGDSTSAPVPEKVLVTPPTNTLDAVGQTLQYSARLVDDKGQEMTEVVFTWAVTNTTVVSVTSSGLVTALKAGSSSVRASAEGITGTAALTIDPLPSQLTKVAGDQQLGTLRQILPERPTVEVLDGNGNPVQGKWVTFSVKAGDGTASPSQAQTGVDGIASTVWQLGCSNDNPQRLDAAIGELTVSFTATVDLNALAICQETVPEGRETHPYSTTLEAAGGDQNTLDWSVVAGGLPPGLTLQLGGGLSGTPTLAGSYQFEALVQDGMGATASAVFGLRICDAPVMLAAGEIRSFSPSGPDACGFFLPAGGIGDRYRFGVVYTSSAPDSTDVPTVTVALSKEFGGAVSSEHFFTFSAGGTVAPSLGPRVMGQASPALLEAMQLSASNRAFQRRLRAAERELIRSFGPDARPLPDARGLTRSSGMALASPDKVSFTNAEEDFASCSVKETVRAIKVRENDVMVIYQDSIQRASDALSDTHAKWMLDHYGAYGPQVIDAYFGGITDINNDGKVVVFVTPVVEEGTVAFVWSGDFFPKADQTRGGVVWEGCAASNEMEMMRFNLSVIKGMSDGSFQALGTLVHETKHISSLYKSIIRRDYQPTWVEEGLAEFAEEMASRIAWAGAGGPAVGAMATASDVTAFTRENYSVILVNAGTTGYLSSQPNGVVVTPSGASGSHSVYGSGWHFHRWLGDAYGNAAIPLGDSTLIRTLNDSLTAAGVQGILDITEAPSWAGLMEEYLTAVMLNGTGTPLGSKAFTSYDFPSMNRSFTYTGKPDGDYPWPVNLPGEDTTAPFASATFIGPIGPSGVRIFDLSSNGTGLGLDVKVTGAGSPSSFRIVLVRIE